MGVFPIKINLPLYGQDKSQHVNNKSKIAFDVLWITFDKRGKHDLFSMQKLLQDKSAEGEVRQRVQVVAIHTGYGIDCCKTK
jgi:hypothetical protein